MPPAAVRPPAPTPVSAGAAEPTFSLRAHVGAATAKSARQLCAPAPSHLDPPARTRGRDIAWQPHTSGDAPMSPPCNRSRARSASLRMRALCRPERASPQEGRRKRDHTNEMRGRLERPEMCVRARTLQRSLAFRSRFKVKISFNYFICAWEERTGICQRECNKAK